MTIPDIPLTPEAQDLFNRIKPRLTGLLEEVKKIPISILIWGPSPDSGTPFSALRLSLRAELRTLGHAAFFSEELVDCTLPYSLRLQQLIQAQSFDLVVSIPVSFGSVGEIHDFAADARVNSKILIFLNSAYTDGYSRQSLEAISSIVTCEIVYYNDSDLGTISSRVINETTKMREIKYIRGGRF